MVDVIIVGGGPAGSSAGRAAARLGLRTLLLEKDLFPRYKPCGGALSMRALSYLDFPIPPEIRRGELRAARVHFRGKVSQGEGSSPIALLVPRDLLDDHLLRRASEAGAEVRQGEKVVGVREEAGRVVVTTAAGEYAAPFAIIAEGAQGRLKTQVRRADGRSEQGICLVAEAARETPDGDSPGVADIHLGLTRWGYGWVFPYRDYCSVGVGGLAATMPRARETMRQFLHANGFDAGCRTRGHLIPVGGIRRTVTRGRVLLCGDAAGFVDAFSGEGMAYAIRSGQLAAGVVARAAAGKASALQAYAGACEREFGRNLRDSRRLSRLMYRFTGVISRAFSGDPRVVRAFLETVSGERTYRSFLCWLLPRLPLLRA